MTLQIIVVLVILLLATVFFVTEWLRVDLVALLVLSSLAVTGLIAPSEAVAGFSSPAVITVWAVFILSGGLARTGVAGFIGRQILRLAGQGEVRLLVVIMLTAGFMSAFMNNVGVAALLLPVVMNIARRTGRHPSKLLMPLAYGALLGGLNTLIGTPPNILVSDILRDYGLRPFQFFDYTPTGLAVLFMGIAFMALVGRHLLPSRDLAQESLPTDLVQNYHLGKQLSVVHLPGGSSLLGQTLAQSQLGSRFNLNVIALIRNGVVSPSPQPEIVFQADDKLLVVGGVDRLNQVDEHEQFIIEEYDLPLEKLFSTEVEMAEVGLSPRSLLLGQTLEQMDFRQRYGVNVLAIWRGGVVHRTKLQHIPLQFGDTLLVQGSATQLNNLREAPDFLISSAEAAEVYRLSERLMAVRIPATSSLIGQTLAESHLRQIFGLTVLGIVRQGETYLAPSAAERLRAEDLLLVEGKNNNEPTFNGLPDLHVEPDSAVDLNELESEQVGLTETVLAPHSTLAGQTLRQIHFREKYGLRVIAIWREGQAYYTGLSDMPLRYGDALLLHGPREKLNILGSESDFIVLVEEAQEAPRLEKAPLAILAMGTVLVPVILGWLPIHIAAIIGAALMVLTQCLTMDEAYRFIEWKAVFLIAGMLPLGLAMEQSGAALFLAEGVVTIVGELGPVAVMASLFVLTTLATQVMPNPAVAVLLAPIALNTATDLSISPYSLLMTVALAASASFLSPVAHPANVLIMGPGSYRFRDYIKVGLPLTVVVFFVTLLVVPIFWPL